MRDMTSLFGRRALLRGGVVLSLGFLASCSTTDIALEGDGSDQTDTTLAYVNDLRRARGLRPLSRDPAAAGAALAQANRMAKADKMAHLIGFNDSFLTRMKTAGVALPAAENIAAGQDSAQKAYTAWHDSPKHLENMLGTNYTGLGVAVVRNPASGNRPYWAMVLSTA